MGFTQFSNIYLYDGDIFDCHKKNKKENTCGPSELQNHRVSFFTGKFKFKKKIDK